MIGYSEWVRGGGGDPNSQHENDEDLVAKGKKGKELEELEG